jgi:hypothetical protein
MRDTCRIHVSSEVIKIHTGYIRDISQLHPERDVSDMKGYMRDTCGIHAGYMRDTCILSGNQDTCWTHARYMRDTCGIHAGYISRGLRECFDAIMPK